MSRLGQHFLKNSAVARDIARAVEPCAGDTIIEVGAGHGELTQELAKSKEQGAKSKDLPQIIAIEKDAGLAEGLRARFKNYPAIKIIEGDGRDTLPGLIKNPASRIKHYKITGNIPYYLTGYLLRVVSELPVRPKLCVFMVQKEVAERAVATPPRMNKLAATLQFWATAGIIRTVRREVFRPVPKVDSALLRLAALPARQGVAADKYFTTVRTLFSQPRKTVLNNVAAALPQCARETAVRKILSAGVDPSARPQNISVNGIISLARIWEA